MVNSSQYRIVCTKCTRIGNGERMTVLLVLELQVVAWLITIEIEYYRVKCVGTRIDKERTHTVLILDSWEPVSLLCTKCTRIGNEEGTTVLLILKPLVVYWLITIENEYYRVKFVGTRIVKERTHTMLIDGQ